MTMLEAFVKERNEALFSLDRKKIEAYMIKYGETEIAQTPDVVFWASVYKAICGIKDAPEAIVNKATAWLHEHGMSLIWRDDNPPIDLPEEHRSEFL